MPSVQMYSIHGGYFSETTRMTLSSGLSFDCANIHNQLFFWRCVASRICANFVYCKFYYLYKSCICLQIRSHCEVIDVRILTCSVLGGKPPFNSRDKSTTLYCILVITLSLPRKFLLMQKPSHLEIVSSLATEKKTMIMPNLIKAVIILI